MLHFVTRMSSASLNMIRQWLVYALLLPQLTQIGSSMETETFTYTRVHILRMLAGPTMNRISILGNKRSVRVLTHTAVKTVKVTVER